MSWLTLLILAAVLVALAALTGIKPKGTRPVAHTRMMTAARIVLGIVALILVIAALTGP